MTVLLEVPFKALSVKLMPQLMIASVKVPLRMLTLATVIESEPASVDAVGRGRSCPLSIQLRRRRGRDIR
jgi:hypothetical protein